MLIALVGKTNCGKSTLFNAATMVDVEISNRVFTTIKPNRGVAYVTSKCVHEELGKECQPVNSKCEKGIRLIPVQMLDVAGLIEGAWKGRGLGNQFLSDLMQAKALIHVLDCAGATDAEGNACEPGSHDPVEDVRFLEREIAYWVKGILEKNWRAIGKKADAEKKPAAGIAKQLSGLGVSEEQVKRVLEKGGFEEKLEGWNEEEMLRFSEEIRKKSKPMIIACNKMDLSGAKENFEKLGKEFPEHKFVACCAEAELALRKAAREGVIEYVPGSGEFKILKELNEKQEKGLEFIKENVLGKYGSTGVQEVINETAFNLLDLVVVYPVQDQNKWCSGEGRLLPDAHLVRKGTTPKQLAGIIHTEFLERYIGAVDCRSKKKLAEDYELKNNDVIRIILKN